jgi:vitamin B12 transporter
MLAMSLGLMVAVSGGVQAAPTVRELLGQSRGQARDLLGQRSAAPSAPDRVDQIPVLAADQPDGPVASNSGTSDSPFELDSVTVTATLRPTRVRDTPGVVYVIDRKEIQQKGARTVGDALRGVPGVVSNLFGAGADVHGTYFIRGLPTTSTALLLDGRPINNLNQEHVDLNELPVAAVERIEVLTSGATTLYGSTAVGGAINVITRRPPKVFEGSAEANWGSYGYSDYRFAFGGPITEAARFNLYANTFNTNNDYFYSVERPGILLSGIREFGAFTSTNYGFDLDIDADERTTITLSSYYRQGARGISLFALRDPREAIEYIDPETGETAVASANELGLNESLTPRIFIDYWGGALTVNRRLGEGDDSNLQVRLSYDRGRTTEQEIEDGEVEFLTTDVGIFGTRLLHAWQLSPGYNLTYGFDLIREGGNSFGSENPLIFEAEIIQPSLFALNTFRPADNLVLTAGLRASFATRAVSREFNRDFGGSVDPSIGIRWQAIPVLALRSTFSKVYKTPNFFDLFGRGEILGNPDVVPETGTTWDVGFDWQPSPTSLIRFSYFLNDITNLLGYNIIEFDDPTDQALAERFDYELNDRIRVNFPRVRSSGFEISANWQFAPNWTLFATETYTDARVEQGFKAAYTQTQYPLVPFHSGRAGISYDNPSGWRAALFVNFQGLRSVDPLHIGPGFASLEGEPVFDPRTGRQVANAGFLPAGSLLPGYATLDLSFRIPLLPNASLLGYIDNLTSVRYERSYGNGAPPINFRLGLNVGF